MFARSDQPTELDGQKASTGARLALSQSLNSARSTDVAIPSYLLTLAQRCASSGWSVVVLLTWDVRAIMWGFMLLYRPSLFITCNLVYLLILSFISIAISDTAFKAISLCYLTGALKCCVTIVIAVVQYRRGMCEDDLFT